METEKEKLKCYAQKINIDLEDKKLEKFLLYKNLLKEWNEKINLTAIVDDDEILVKHFIDSLTIEKHVPQNAKMIDVGTGAGFPGIPIKIVRDDVEVVLLDSLNKRIKFLNEVIERCQLENITAIHGRAEDLGNNANYRETFDVSTARAVANIATLSELCTPFVKIGGSFICMKADAESEMREAEKAIRELNIKCEKVDKFLLEGASANRSIIIYRKEFSTPKKYPRKAGVPAKCPIL